MIKLKLNGWMRLYAVFLGLWLLFTLLSFFTNLPNRYDLPDPEQLARVNLSAEIERIQNTASIDQLHTEADRVCEAAYNKTNINKNLCMEFLINPKSLDISTRAIMEAHIISSKIEEKTIELKRKQDEELHPAIIETSLNHLKQAIIIPILLLGFGYATAWIRRGFSQSNKK